MDGFDLKTAVQAVSKMVDDLTELAKNGQDNKTKRYESDNKRAVELKKEGTQKILAAGQVVNNIGSAANHLGSAYKNIRSAEGDLEKARAEATKAQAEIKKADAVLERAKNEKSKKISKLQIKRLANFQTKILGSPNTNYILPKMWNSTSTRKRLTSTIAKRCRI